MIVMKFGGTSVECAESILRAARIVRGRLWQQPVVVVSALARVTDQLLSMGQSAAEGKPEEMVQLLEEVEQRHYQVLRHCLTGSHSALVKIKSELQRDFESLLDLGEAIAAVGELSPRTTDRLLCFGEYLSSRIVAAAFVSQGLPAILVDAQDCMITDANYTRANPLIPEIHIRLAQKLVPLLQQNRVPVLGGFIASTLHGVPTTLGRGGSDFTASIIGASMGAKSIEIWTDVDGMMTADPRICPEARNIESISFDEAAELAHFGAKVLHPKTLSPAIENNIPVYILNSRRPQNKGTRVDSLEPPGEGRVKSITHKRGVAVVEISTPQGINASLVRTLFEWLEQQHCFMDVVAMSRSSISLLLNSADIVPALTGKLKGVAEVRAELGKGMVCLVGHNIARDAAITAKLFGGIADVRVSMICHGSSDRHISFVVDEDQTGEVVRRLHHIFFPVSEREPASSVERLPTGENPPTAPTVSQISMEVGG